MKKKEELNVPASFEETRKITPGPSRLYIEDEDREKTEAEFRRSQRQVYEIKGPGNTPEVFDTVIFDALFGHDNKDTWEQVKKHEEIYCSTSLVPLMGSVGSGTLFNGLMYKAIEEKVGNTRIYILNNFDSIWWHELKEKLVRGTFLDLNNELYTFDKDHDHLVRVDIEKLINEKL